MQHIILSIKITNKKRKNFQQIVSHHSSDIDFKDFMKLYKDYTEEPSSILFKDTTLPLDDLLKFWKNL